LIKVDLSENCYSESQALLTGVNYNFPHLVNYILKSTDAFVGWYLRFV